jgi:DNA repair protein RadC
MSPLIEIAELKVTYQNIQEVYSQPKIMSSEDGYQILQEYFPEDTVGLKEQVIVLYLNNSNRVIGIYRVSDGGITGSVVDIRLILGTALKVAATGLILAHNHPSGNLMPSESDKILTKKLKEGAAIMDLKLHDHLILSPEEYKYYSFYDKGDL